MHLNNITIVPARIQIGGTIELLNMHRSCPFPENFELGSETHQTVDVLRYAGVSDKFFIALRDSPKACASHTREAVYTRKKHPKAQDISKHLTRELMHILFLPIPLTSSVTAALCKHPFNSKYTCASTTYSYLKIRKLVQSLIFLASKDHYLLVNNSAANSSALSKILFFLQFS